MDPNILQSMMKAPLRDLASKTHGITTAKKTPQGKWIHKTTKELKTELLALMPGCSTHALPGRRIDRQHRASSNSRRLTTKRRPASTHALQGRPAAGRRIVKK
jgi:hypothetical protein